MMKRVLTIAFGLLAISALPAAAADLPVKAPMAAPYMAPAFSWTGAYIGVHAGYNWGRTSVVDRDAYNTVALDNWTFNNNGFVGGGQIGYNWQASNFVFGVEADLGYLNAKGSGVAPAGCRFFACDTVASTSSDFYATVRGRLGIAWNQWMLYGTGGFIGINSNTSVTDNCIVGACGAATINATEKTFRTGWTAGGGVEVAVGGPWSVKAEYLYYDLGNRTISANAFFPPSVVPGALFRFDTNSTGNIVRAGINYRFGMPDAVVARY